MQEFRLRVNDRVYDIGIEDEHMTVEGFDLNWQMLEAEESHFQVCIDGILYEVNLRATEDGRLVAVVEGEEYPVEAIGLTRGRPASKKREEGPAVTVAPEMVEGALTAMMPSKVIAVHAQEGDQVQSGQVVLILEAMKMESELQAPHDGVVTAVNCAPGDSVDPGVPLMVIEPHV